MSDKKEIGIIAGLSLGVVALVLLLVAASWALFGWLLTLLLGAFGVEWTFWQGFAAVGIVSIVGSFLRGNK